MLQLRLITVLFTVSLLSHDAHAQSRGQTEPQVPTDPSGWLRLEVAVFIDNDERVLASETWPATPTRDYDENRRWLTEFEETAGLLDEYPGAELILHPNGSITVVEPEPIIVKDISETDASESIDLASDEIANIFDSTSATSDRGGEFDDAAASGQPPSSLSMLREVLESDDLMPEEAVAPSPDRVAKVDLAMDENAGDIESKSDNSRITPVDMDDLLGPDENSGNPIGSEANVIDPLTGESAALSSQQANIDDLFSGPGNMDPSELSSIDSDIIDLPDLGFGGGLDSDLESPPIDWLDSVSGLPEDSDLLTDNNEAALRQTPAALPTAFERLSLEMLNQGLDSLKKLESKTPIYTAAWVQPSDAESQSLIADTWYDGYQWPRLQGTITITLGDTPELAANLWLNTEGSYMPDNFRSAAPPEPDTRLTIIEAPFIEAPLPQVDSATYIDITTGLSTQEGSPFSTESKASFDNKSMEWHWRHSIALKESKPMREGYIRYIDHPAIQVVGVWREVTWAELNEMGEREKLTREIDSLTRALTEETSETSSSLIPTPADGIEPLPEPIE